MARASLLSRRAKLGAGIVVPPVASNVADQNAYWVGPLGPIQLGQTIVDTSTAQEMTVEDFAFFKAKGMDAIMVFAPNPTLYPADSNRFPPDPIGMDLSAAQYHDARILRDEVKPKCDATGVGMILITGLKDLTQPGAALPSDLDELRNWASFAKNLGCIGVFFDAENYPDYVNGVTSEIWGGQEHTTLWRNTGYDFGRALGLGWPDVALFAYHNFISGTTEELLYATTFDPNGQPTGYASGNFYYGLTLGLADTAPDGNWSLQFAEATTYYRGSTRGYRQQDASGPSAFFSRKWPHWFRIFDRVAVQPFIWIDKGVGNPPSGQEIPYHPTNLAASHQDLRNWHVVTRGDPRVLPHFVYGSYLNYEGTKEGMIAQDLDCYNHAWPEDYEAYLTYMSTPAVVANNAPSLTITTPANGSTTSAASITTVVGEASDDFGVVGVTWQNASQPATFVVTVVGTPTGGTHALKVTAGGSTQETSGIAHNANAATIAAALAALSNVGSGNVGVTGSGPFTVTFAGALATADVSMARGANGLTGGTRPGWAVAESPVRNGHLAMTFVKVSGSYATTITSWRHDLGISDQAPAIPLVLGSNVITFTARDSKGATTSVVRSVTRT